MNKKQEGDVQYRFHRTRKRAKARENELLAKMSLKDTPINFSSKDWCLKRSYGGLDGDCRINVTGMLVISLRGVKSQILVSLRVFGTESTIFVHTGVA